MIGRTELNWQATTAHRLRGSRQPDLASATMRKRCLAEYAKSEGCRKGEGAVNAIVTFRPASVHIDEGPWRRRGQGSTSSAVLAGRFACELECELCDRYNYEISTDSVGIYEGPDTTLCTVQYSNCPTIDNLVLTLSS
jgi:hypothetical protein